MKCEELIVYLSDYIDNNLDEELVAIAEDHLATCKNCSVVLDSTQKTIALYRENTLEKHLTAKRHERLYGAIAEAFAQKPTN